MRAARAKRRWLAWNRYVGRCEKVTEQRFRFGRYTRDRRHWWPRHQAMAAAYARYQEVGRVAPHGIREPWWVIR